MKIQIRKKNVYGNDLTYPVNEAAMLATKPTGLKTFTQVHLETLKAMGFEIELVL